MDDSAKYLIHADVTASGVVERDDVVGAVYGQTEGLLGDELDLRYLQEASKVGRIDVDVDSEGGRSFGELTIATSMDRVETAVLAASLETIGRVGPCRAEFRVTGIEDVRAAKRREVVDRATELLAESFDQPAASSEEILEEVRRAVRVEDITEYEGLPAGPNVADSDAVIVVEGRADVLQLLEYGIKNGVAVEGTDVPDVVADLTRERTVTAFLDGDRGGDLILEELSQVGEIDHVALAPPERSVEDLSRREVMSALRGKVAYDQLDDPTEVASVPTDGGTVSVPDPGRADDEASPRADAGEPEVPAADAAPTADPATTADETADAAEAAADETGDADGTDRVAGATIDQVDDAGADEGDDSEGGTDPETLGGHVRAVDGAGTVRLLDATFGLLAAAPADEAFDAVEGADPAPAAVVLDGALTQRLLDVAAQRGVEQVVAEHVGNLVKQPAGVRVRTADQLQ
jgi:DNA primase